MSEDTSASLFVILADEVTSGQITVSLDAYVEYCLRLESELEILATRFAQFATPNASLVRRGSL